MSESLHVAFEDRWLIVVNKPVGLPTQNTRDPRVDHLFAAVKRFLTERDGVKDPYVGLHHRLDRDTSGLVLLTKVREANKGVSELFKGRGVEKTYTALVALQKGEGPRVDEWTVQNFLKAPPGKGKGPHRVRSVQAGGDFACTEFKVLKKKGPIWLMEARPKTGRMHQIRVHLAEMGLPVIGDRLYGDPVLLSRVSKELGTNRLMLHAQTLGFNHPMTKKVVVINAPLPEEFHPFYYQ